jgi:long-chain acyl-CoA synthetase
VYFFEKELRTENGLVAVPRCFKQGIKRLVLLVCRNNEITVASYISALRARHAVMLVDYTLHKDLLHTIIKQYKPYYIVGLEQMDGYEKEQGILRISESTEVKIHEDLAVLLSTSGTTGSPKFVRLSYNNLQRNAESIVEYLLIDGDERAIMNLPLSYSYGMSIVNSYMQASAILLLTEQSVMEKKFWSYVAEQQATSMAGVPFTYQMLRRIGFMKMDLPHLRTLTQAGGRLHETEVRAFAEYAQATQKCFFVMYGQTEAAPRMSYIPYKRLIEKAGTIGIAVPGGRFDIDGETSELIYYGDNVMMGYAESLADLAKSDELGGVLHTGDTATIDEDGYYTITGRLKRFIKLFGLRINLDDIERKLEAAGYIVACTGNDDKLLIATEVVPVANDIGALIQQWYKLHQSAYRVYVLEALPRFSNGKINYNAVKEMCL